MRSKFIQDHRLIGGRRAEERAGWDIAPGDRSAATVAADCTLPGAELLCGAVYRRAADYDGVTGYAIVDLRGEAF